MSNNSKGKPIDYQAIEESRTKVNIGIKGEPRLKMELVIEAQKLGLTLSEYSEIILENRNESKHCQELKRKVNFYENKTLRHLFNINKGKQISFTDNNGKEHKLHIDTIQDIYTVIINTLKI
ncbi:hypothetical protein SAMN06298216_3562 [Spirosomataceae bacterium TFI 002]|nr:hypothetical protein SAMN06298216_3562 [Spirosomataceae bacterium TFI 002]